eukprot:Platyproteum_vivax@DN8495_c0_g1_i1.p1
MARTNFIINCIIAVGLISTWIYWLQDHHKRGRGSTSDLSGEVNVCGPVGENSWQEVYAGMMDGIVSGQRKKLAVVQECSRRGDLCGGLGDRMRGLTNILFMAMLSQRHVLLYQEKPASLHHAMLPNNHHSWWNVSEIPRDVLYWRHPKSASDATNDYDYVVEKNAKRDYIWSEDHINELHRRFYVGGTGKMLFEYPWPRNESIVRLMANAPINLHVWHELKLTSYNFSEVQKDVALQKIRSAINLIQPEYLIGCAYHFLFKPAPRMLAYLESSLVMTLFNKSSNQVPTQGTMDKIATGKLHLLPVREMAAIPSNPENYLPRVTLTEHLATSSKVSDDALKVLGFSRGSIPKLIGIHFRVSGRNRNGLKWNDTGGIRTQPEQLINVIRCAFRLAEWSGWYNVKVIFVSDDAEVRAQATSAFPGKVFVPPLIDGPEHADKPSAGTTDVGDKTIETWNDILILSLCDGLVLTNSGFGRLAASIALLPMHRVVHWASNKKDNCNLRARHTKSY